MQTSIGRGFNFSLPALIANFGAIFGGADVGARRWVQIGVVAGWALIGSGYAFCACRRGDRETEFCLLCIAVVAGGVTGWGYYFVLLIFPAVALATRLRERGTWYRRLWLVLGVLLMNVMDWQTTPVLERHFALKLLANELPLYGAIVLGALWFTEPHTPAPSS